MSASARLATPRTRIEEAKARFTIPVQWRMFNLRGDPDSSCRSPFREDRSPSFSVSDDGCKWIDFATGERGDAIDFLAKIKGISGPEAFIELLNMADGPAEAKPPAARSRSPEAKPEAKPEAPKRPDLSGLEICRDGDLAQIQKLRSIPLEGLLLASQRTLLGNHRRRQTQRHCSEA